MNALLMSVIGYVLAQTEDPLAAPEEPVYVITLNDTGEKIYGFVDEKDWERGTIARVTLDMPWSPQPVVKRVNPAKATLEREWSGARERRLAEQAAAVGLNRVGEGYYRAEEVEWARKAREMARLADAAEAEATTEASDASAAEPEPVASGGPSVSEPAPEAPGFVRRWGKHVAIVVAALALLGVTAKWLLFD
ncbi:MAG TPA: hypothetical protein PLO37_03405 [Candidatus Hydrogenedentes bacterium]|nr:hypothetical protein [Candidatus Hydrogenedentota bacterium]HPG65867.1 hypothetical protein [Candidatus Hydrogenedentota bacterium]